MAFLRQGIGPRQCILALARTISRFTRVASTASAIFAILLGWLGFSPAAARAQTFALSDTKDLALVNLKVDAVEYKGRKAVRLTKDTNAGGKTDFDGFAFLKGTDFQDGTVEGDVALKITAPPGARTPGFVGIAFRARSDASRFELFYLRPGNSHSDDQAMRNHSVQYTSEPDFGWYRLRREWPFVYESHAELQSETWTKVRIEVKGRAAKLYLNGSEQPSLVVDGMKGEDLSGEIALWSYQNEEAYFSNFRVTNATPLPLKNGSDARGTWQVRCFADVAPIDGTLQLNRDGTKATGTWSGEYLGKERRVTGTWRDGCVALTFNADWPIDDKGGATPALATLVGRFDGDSAGGRMNVEAKTDGPWTATRKP